MASMIRASFAVALVGPFFADAAKVRKPTAQGSSHFMARLVTDANATDHSKANHYGCVEICKAGEGRCIAACEVDMYKCSSMAPMSAQDACFEEKTEKYANFEKEPAGNGTNGSNETAFVVASAYVEPHFVASKSNHYGCVEICKAGEGRCIAACETEMYWCEGKPTKEAEEECLTTTADKFKKFEEGNKTAGNGTNKSALLVSSAVVAPNLVARRANHYGCVEICTSGEARCIAACETEMYWCEGKPTPDAEEECLTTTADKFKTFEEGNKTAGNGTNKSAFLAATARIAPNLVVSRDQTVHYRCQSICSVRFTSENNGMCISECETTMYRCQSLSTDGEVKACETKIEDKWTKKEETGNATNGTNGTK